MITLKVEVKIRKLKPKISLYFYGVMHAFNLVFFILEMPRIISFNDIVYKDVRYLDLIFLPCWKKKKIVSWNVTELNLFYH